MLGGLIADRVDRKKFLMLLSVEQLVFSFALAWVVRAHSPSLVLITLMVVLVGAGGAMFGPAYPAVLPGHRAIGHGGHAGRRPGAQLGL